MAEAVIRSVPDPETMHRSQDVRANGKSVRTPVVALDYNKVDPSVDFGGRAGYIHEMYLGISRKRILDNINGAKRDVRYALNSYTRRFRNPSNLRLCFLKYLGPGFPRSREVDFLAGLSHANSDITPIPMVSDFLRKTTDAVGNNKFGPPSERGLAAGKKYITDAIGAISRYGRKPIMGYLPDYGPYLAHLVELYRDAGINAFYFDAAMANPMTVRNTIGAIMGELEARGILERSFIHMINANYGRGERDWMIPAKSVLGFGLGIDGLGEAHMPPRRLREVYTRAAGRPAAPRLFLKDRYAYYRFPGRAGADLYPADSSVDMERFMTRGRADRMAENAFNVEQLALECSRLGAVIRGPESTAGYLGGKKYLEPKDLGALRRDRARGRR